MSRRADHATPLATRDYIVVAVSDDLCAVEVFDEPRQLFTAAELDRFIRDLQRVAVEMRHLT